MLVVFVLLREAREGRTSSELRDLVEEVYGEPISDTALRRCLDTIDYAAPRLGYRFERLGRGVRDAPRRFRVRDSIRTG